MSRSSLTRKLAVVFAIGMLSDAGAEAEGYARCIVVDPGNSMGQFIVNRCNVKLAVKWYDDGECRTGCRLDVGPRGKQSAGKIGDNMHFGACEWPTNPTTNSRMVKYSCGGPVRDGASSGTQQPGQASKSKPRSPASGSTPDKKNPDHPSGTGMSFGSGSIKQCPPLEDFYPPGALRQGITGRVVVYVHATDAGRPMNVSVLTSSGYANLDEAALKYARVCRYNSEPGYSVSEVVFAVKFLLQQ